MPAHVRPFEVVSADGTRLVGQADMPAEPSGTAVIFGSGSGVFDRDMRYGRSGTPRDRVFADLAERLNRRGVMAVRHDRRGVRYGVEGPAAIDPQVTIKGTTGAQVEDMRAIYDWTRSADGLAARRVVFFVHSEGALHVGRLAASGAPAPAAMIAMGGLMESPKAVLHWQMAERDAESIASLDADGDGVTTNDEVRAGIGRTPGANSPLEPLLSASGTWTAADLDALRTRQHAAWEEARRAALAEPDGHPYPNAEITVGPFQWWKSWFLDETPNAVNLAHWRTTMFHLHYGSIDSQTNLDRQVAAARAALPAERLAVTLHPGVGHGLGPDPAIGPIEEAIAERIADEAAAA